ncbi:GP-PDE domain-containing protein [Sulfidibacter corallicola]|uniref:GP-PDE domain-containing protein n=1 Tax=Sulfidibacter corallicola TaxID=2818388 RepID=A0A8A4TXZ8_SULCO|nr:glycerophosphodiester phosphodiesterase family protein [Sulfidibacter corallicola]QTD54363.1 hypothetical protein J3U87_18105 [Sulfidibacter corallicola]
MNTKLTRESTSTLAIAHRGFSSAFPENTLPAFDAALELPIQGIEFDVQLTREGIPIVFHDKNFRRVGGGMKLVRARILQQLDQVDFGSWFDRRFRGIGPLTLKTFMHRYAGRCLLLLEIKPEGGSTRMGRRQQLMERVIDMVREFQVVDSVRILCFDLDLLRYGHEIAKDFHFVLNQTRPAIVEDDAFLAAYSANIKRLRPQFVQAVHAKGKPVYSYTVNDATMLQKALDCGVDAVMSDDPRWLTRTLATYQEKTTT